MSPSMKGASSRRSQRGGAPDQRTRLRPPRKCRSGCPRSARSRASSQSGATSASSSVKASHSPRKDSRATLRARDRPGRGAARGRRAGCRRCQASMRAGVSSWEALSTTSSSQGSPAASRARSRAVRARSRLAARLRVHTATDRVGASTVFSRSPDPGTRRRWGASRGLPRAWPFARRPVPSWVQRKSNPSRASAARSPSRGRTLNLVSTSWVQESSWVSRPLAR